MSMVAQAFAPHLLCEISEHVGDLLDLFVVASTRGVALSRVLVAVHL